MATQKHSPTTRRLGPMILLAVILFFAGRIDGFRSLLPSTSPRRVDLSTVGIRTSFAYSASRLYSTSQESSQKSTVVYQKVVRPPPNVPAGLFLPSLVEYLQDRFELPERLPMVYEAAEGKGKHVLSWDSSLSPCSDNTCLQVQVVAINTDESNQASMAMVAVSKADTDNKLPTLLESLFADSEKQILRALDRGLEDYAGGKIRNLVSEDTALPTEAMWSELAEDVEGLEQAFNSARNENAGKGDIVDAEIVPSQEEEDSRREAAMKVMQAKAESKPTETSTPKGLDFAVQAAKKAARKRSGPKEEFAVKAAREAASKREKVSKPSAVPTNASKQEAANNAKKSKSLSKKKSAIRMDQDAMDQLDISNVRPPSLNPNASGKRKAFMHSISKPSDFQKSTNQEEKSPTANIDAAHKGRSSSREGTTIRKGGPVPPARKINMNIRHDEKEAAPGKDDVDDITEPQQQEIIKLAQDALTELEESGMNMSPEEMLNEVIQFGEQTEKEESVGEGFVSGAFEKAKDILREQRQQREDRLKQQVVNRVTTDVKDVPPAETIENLSPEEELRQMFEAGERIADGRITTVSNPSAAMIDPNNRASKDEIDEAIASDKTVSSYARILDDELAELEVRINKSPGEEMDGPAKNAMFDIFSGPEVYDRNVDPETAVNWPGAIPGTKNVRLPNQLDEAVKQAKFAAEVLMSLKETNENDSTSGKYFVGDRELSQQQVENLRSVVEEAVEIGLIDDPLNQASEFSRMQMLLDELWNQPEERYRDIISNYKDLLLSDNFVMLIKRRLNQMADRDLDALRRDDDSLEEVHSRERALLGQIVVNAQLLLKEARALGAELEAQQLEVIRSICKVAMDPNHQTEEETAMALSDAVRDMRPLLDEGFVAYLKYAIAEEEGSLARSGVLDDPEYNQWLFVLKIVQQGVYTEISRGISRYIDHIFYVLRMETPFERRKLLEKLIDALPTLDVRPFVQVVENIAGSLGDSAKGEFEHYTELGEMTNKLLQLRRDMHELLPEDRIKEMSRDADEWAAKKKERMLEQRNLTKKRLQAARQTEHLDDEAETLSRGGEYDRFD